VHAPAASATNLPHYFTPIVGRAKEVAAIETLLGSSRCVTIVGPGGIGKTRVAVQVAANLAGTYADGSWFADLGSLTDATQVVMTVANAAGIELRESPDPAAALATALQSRAMLIVFDNCEHVLSESGRVGASLVEACPGVRVLATSREAHGVAGETTYTLDTLDEASSVALFVERARTADPGFALTDGNTATVAEICRRLDGIALAIELAAARVAAISLKTLLTRLDERFRLLAGAGQTGRPRHQTMRALIDWSYDLLSEDKKTVFCRLGVFSGEFSLDAATCVAGDERIEAWEVPDRLTALVEKSMVARSAERAQRYRLLESMRDYALRRLREREGEEERTRRAHAEFFAARSAEADAAFGVESEEAWRACYEPDLGNFRAALVWALNADPALAAQMIGHLKEFWFHSNLIAEGLSRSQAVLAALELDHDHALLPVLLAVGTLAWRAGDFRYSLEAGERALAIAARKGDRGAAATARYISGWARFKLGDTARGIRELHDAVEVMRATEPNALRTLLAEIDYAIALKRSHPAEGHAMLRKVAESARASGWPRTTTRIEIGLAEYEFLTGNHEAAIARARRVVESSRANGSGYSLAVALGNLASYLTVEGAYAQARETGNEAIAIGRTLGIRIAVEWAIQSLGAGLAAEGDPRLAARLLGHVDAFADESGEREPTEATVRARFITLLEEKLDAQTLAAEMTAGRDLSIDAACAALLS
jgi:predicted ATPase